MALPMAAWRVTYTPGNWLVLSGPTVLVTMLPAPARMSGFVGELWGQLIQAASPDALLKLVSEYGLDGMPDFGAFFWSSDGLHVLARGQVKVYDTDTGQVVADGGEAMTWREELLGGERRLRIDMEPVDQDQVLQLPLVVGATTASAIYLSSHTQDVVRFPSAEQRGILPSVQVLGMRPPRREDSRGGAVLADSSASEPAAPDPGGDERQPARADMAGPHDTRPELRGHPASAAVPEPEPAATHDAAPGADEQPDQASAGATALDPAAGIWDSEPSQPGPDEAPADPAAGIWGEPTSQPSAPAPEPPPAPPAPPPAPAPQAPAPDFPPAPQPQISAPPAPDQAFRPPAPAPQFQPSAPGPDAAFQPPAPPPQFQPTAAAPHNPGEADADAFGTGQLAFDSGMHPADGAGAQGLGESRSAPVVVPPQQQGSDDDGGTIFSTDLAASRKVPAGNQAMTVMCQQGHPNPPVAQRCRVCGAPLEISSTRPMRPEDVAGINSNQGEFLNLGVGLVVGRAPDAAKGPQGAQVMRVTSPSSDISRNHILIAARDWNVVVTDLNSTNGTTVMPPGGEHPFVLSAGQSVQVELGTVLDLGDGVSLRVEPPRG